MNINSNKIQHIEISELVHLPLSTSCTTLTTLYLQHSKTNAITKLFEKTFLGVARNEWCQHEVRSQKKVATGFSSLKFGFSWYKSCCPCWQTVALQPQWHISRWLIKSEWSLWMNHFLFTRDRVRRVQRSSTNTTRQQSRVTSEVGALACTGRQQILLILII